MTENAASTPSTVPSGVSRWRHIRDVLAGEIGRGQFAPDGRLPSEQALARRFAVHRHTVRQALQSLAADGHVRIERGRGTFACPEPLRYALGRRTSFTANVTDQGRQAARQLESIQTIRASATVAAQLALSRGALVLQAITVAAADGVPLARGQHHFPLQRFPSIEAALRDTGGISAALARCGIGAVARARTVISTRPATPEEVVALGLAPRQPVLVTEGQDVDTNGRPVQFGLTAFAGSRVELEVIS